VAYHDELSTQAQSLVASEDTGQAGLRRGISAAYYAVFHLLIAEAIENWHVIDLRTELGRAFDHGNMRQVSQRVEHSFDHEVVGADPSQAADLRFVAGAFTRLQVRRHWADYDLRTVAALEGAQAVVSEAKAVFAAWGRIRHSVAAQRYLVAMLVRR
jgi:uncharacterized protein (UPF0332 family)